MIVSLVQAALAWEQSKANLDQLARILADLPAGTDIVVLPEMFSTGFSMRSEALAEAPDGPTAQWMLAQAKAKNAAVCGSFICSDNGHFYNRFSWAQPDGQSHFYDKKHLFTLAGEHHAFSPGEQVIQINWRGWNIRPLICYDLRFPIWSRQPIATEDQYDLLLYVANWPQRRSHHWRSLLTARAIENQAYTLGVNIVGTDGNGLEYLGDTMAIDYAGTALAHGTSVPQVLTVALDLEAQRAYRAQLPFLADEDWQLPNLSR